MMNDLDQSIDGGRFISPGTSCENCTQQASCGIWRGVTQMFEQYPCVDPMDLAAICDEYDPIEP